MSERTTFPEAFVILCFSALLAIGLTMIGSAFFGTVLGENYTCTRYEIIGESPDRHEVCAVYERKEGV